MGHYFDAKYVESHDIALYPALSKCPLNTLIAPNRPATHVCIKTLDSVSRPSHRTTALALTSSHPRIFQIEQSMLDTVTALRLASHVVRSWGTEERFSSQVKVQTLPTRRTL